MFTAIIIILSLPFTDTSRFRGMQFNKNTIFVFFFFVGNFLILMTLGAKHVESPYIILGQIAGLTYFLYFGGIPLLSIFQNTFVHLNNLFEKK